MKYLPFLGYSAALVLFPNPVTAESSVEAKSFTTIQIANDYFVSANQKYEQRDFQGALADYSNPKLKY